MEDSNMLMKLKEKIESLSREASDIVERREHFMNSIEGMNVRLTQIAGAISELSSIIEGEEEPKEKIEEPT
jgi:predicted  nucleic acid-binding Zn-ribbon protein